MQCCEILFAEYFNCEIALKFLLRLEAGLIIGRFHFMKMSTNYHTQIENHS